jgi:DedD protein
VNSLTHNTDDEEEHATRGSGGDREITLGTTMILLIFFALAVYGAALFGFGYSMGSKHSAGATTAVNPAPASSSAFSTFSKPSPGNPLDAKANKPADADAAPYTPPAVVRTVPLPAEPPAQASPSDGPAPSAVSTRTAVAPSTSNTTAPPLPVPVPGLGTIVVQVAAVSHQEDADLIATTLRRRGYVVNIRTEADKLLHVQVGPFTNRKDADTMKARLLADGFNAYIK